MKYEVIFLRDEPTTKVVLRHKFDFGDKKKIWKSPQSQLVAVAHVLGGLDKAIEKFVEKERRHYNYMLKK